MSAVLEPMHVIRPMKAADIAAVLRVERASYDFPWSAGNFHDSIVAGYSAWVYEVGGVVVGHAVLMAVAGEAHLLNLTISPGWRRQGLGKAFLHHLLDTATQHRASVVFLEVRPSNAAAIALYEQLGFEAFALRKGYYPAANGREDALVMRRLL